MTDLLVTIGVCLAALTSLLMLKRAWRVNDAARPWLIVGGWTVFLLTCVAAAPFMGTSRGPFFALAVIGAVASVFVMVGVERRSARKRAPREAALEPSDRASKAWRGWVRVLLAGPLGMFASMGVAILFVVFAPGAAQTRLVIGGLMVPVLWGGAMAWTLSDDRILRAAAALTLICVVTFGAAALKGF